MKVEWSMAALAAMLATASPAGAQQALPDLAPLPFARPAMPSGDAFDRMATGSVAAPPASRAEAEATPVGLGLDALGNGEIDIARSARDALPMGSIERKALAWSIATSGTTDVGSAEIAATARELSGWPGAGRLREQFERALAREEPAPRAVLAALGNEAPRTPEGVILLARARLASGDAQAARALLVPYWRAERLDARHEMAIIGEFAGLIPQADHRHRMERMLHADRIASAERVADLAGAPELVRAFAAVSRNAGDAAALLDAVPEAQRSAIHVFARSRHLRRTGQFREAAEAMLEAPTDAASLVDPDAWWVERRVLSRELLDIGDPRLAYRLAAAHAAESPALAVDAEFHAGWYAFRGLGDPVTGARHFGRMAEVAEGPISLARAHYWSGRAAEAGGPGNAADHYGEAARHDIAFYGQLAAAKLGRTTLASAAPMAGEADRAAFEARDAVRAIRVIENAGHPGRAAALYRALGDELDSVGEVTLLAQMTEARGDHYLALRIAKQAAQRGLDIGALSHPTGAIPADADISGSGMALAYAIARQESEFNVGARSGAGALGLLQLMPATARDMARKTGLDYAQARLTSDAAYNATLGTRYLDEQLARFGGSYVLTFAGYNAGPGRARDWVHRYGDPRGKPVETVVDWIERIPFTETRGYVQRVMENYQVYKARLTGRMDIEADLVEGRRQPPN